MSQNIYEYLQSTQTIDPDNFVLPTTKDFNNMDLSHDFKKLNRDNINHIESYLYFIEKPYSEVPGYYSDADVIIAHGTPTLANSHLGYFDADTVYFPLKNIKDNNAVVIHNGGQFFIKDYLQYASMEYGSNPSIGVRFLGINAPESNKYTVVFENEIAENEIIPIKKEAIKNNSATHNGRKYTVILDTNSEDYRQKDTIEFVLKPVATSDTNGKTCLCQLIRDIKYTIQKYDEASGQIYNIETTVYAYLTKAADSNDNQACHAITDKLVDLLTKYKCNDNGDLVDSDGNTIKWSERTSKGVVDGAKEVVMMLDHKILNENASTYPTTYDSTRYSTDIKAVVHNVLEQLKSENSGPYYSGFMDYGQDGYGRFLGCLYVKTRIPDMSDEEYAVVGDQWINITKYLLYYFYKNDRDDQLGNTLELSFNPDEPIYQENFNFASNAFNLHSYDRTQYQIMEELENVSGDNIKAQREIQKKIFGVSDLQPLRDWTVMIGDCAFLIPPTSIRCITRNNSESIPLIRSRGSAIRELGQGERIIEMTLFFNDEQGINGIEYDAEDSHGNWLKRYNEETLVYEGEHISYYMNGLRALISIFKLCPFMPIVNTYINDVLNVEAVALSGLSISTVPGYPKCISASLQLLEFNYHAYMSEIPLSGDEEADEIVNTNMFEKCIDYDSLRYYYQKPIYRGQKLKGLDFSSDEYFNSTYGSKTALQPMEFGDSSIEFYLPNANHLDKLLQAKLEAIANPIKTQYKITDDAKEWAKKLGSLYPKLTEFIASKEYEDLINFLKYGPISPNDTNTRLLDQWHKEHNYKNDYRVTTEPSVYFGATSKDKYNDYANIILDKIVGEDNDISSFVVSSNSNYILHPDNSWLAKYYDHDQQTYWSAYHISSYDYYTDEADPPETRYTNFIRCQFNLSQIIVDQLSAMLPTDDIVNISGVLSSGSIFCGVKITLKSLAYRNNIVNFLKNLSIGIDSENYSTYYNDGQIILTITHDSGDTIIPIEESPLYKVIQICYYQYTLESSADLLTLPELQSDVMQNEINSLKQSGDIDSNDTLKFVKFPNDEITNQLIVTNITASMNNNLSKIYLKALDGYAPQYLGGSDTLLEITMMTNDESAIAAINLLPKLCAEYMRNYRLVLACCPLRINTQLTRLLGINEVLIESVDTSTIDKQPGWNQITMRLIAADRTLRNKEALKKLDINNAGYQGNSATSSYAVRDYFDIKNKISAAEVYPDLELPTIAELDIHHFRFIKYKIYDTGRVYPDPDFYFVYGAEIANQLIRDTILQSLGGETYEIEDYSTTNEMRYSDCAGGQLLSNVTRYSAINENVSTPPIMSSSYNKTTQNEDTAETDAALIIHKYLNHRIQDALKTEYVKITKLPTTKDYEISAYTVNTLNNVVALSDTSKCWHISNDASLVFNTSTNALHSEINELSEVIDVFAKYSDYCTHVHEIDNYIDVPSCDSEFDCIYELLDSDATLSAINKKSRKNIKEYITRTTSPYYHTIFKDDIFNNDYSLNTSTTLYNICSSIEPSAISGPEKLYSTICAIGDANTGADIYTADLTADAWQFNFFQNTDNIPKPYYMSAKQCDSIAEIIGNAVSYGPFGIQMYNGLYIKQHFKNALTEFSIDVNALLPNQLYFLNPAVMSWQISLDSSDNENVQNVYRNNIIQYKLKLLYSPEFSASEAANNIFIYLMALAKDKNLIISDYELLTYKYNTQDFNQIKEVEGEGFTTSIHISGPFDSSVVMPYTNDDAQKAFEEFDDEEISKIINAYSNYVTIKATQSSGSTEYDVSVITNDKNKDTMAPLEAIISSTNDVFVALNNALTSDRSMLMYGNIIAAAALHVAGGFDSDFYILLESQDIHSLDDIILSAQKEDTGTDMLLNKFFLALCGRGVIDGIENLGVDNFTGSELSNSIINQSVNIEQMNDPYTYTRDSFYDMITSDMRGRMCRAFPTFYMMFVDEGREIGLWKLNDNFYNMSSISEIAITKSRKIAADTCTVQMTNMFKTFTTDDEDGKEMAYDLETLTSMSNGFEDLRDSIFSPRKLFLRDYRERMEQNPIDRAQLRPGVRMHVRMGYGSDAYSLPIVFNGVVAEVSTGELVSIVCQGDGVELTNVFTDSITSEDITNYDKFPGIKQIANWINNGASPKTILTGFLTTKGKWMQTELNKWSKGRFFDDNAFGINHFGDPDYKDIFGASECTQNIYEAQNGATFNTDATYCTGLQSMYTTTNIPKVSTAIMGKSYWDLMHTMAGISLDYVASVVPFGLRSSIFYGLPHYYCAYEYTKDDTGRIKEKRKPFQQYHIYSSFGDIIENNISTSSEYMKTNAIGLYSEKGFIGIAGTKQVGPVYVDVDIYSEYQKSMTVDTTLVAQNTLGSFLVPFWNTIVSGINGQFGTSLGSDNENIAWRITARALKDSVKEMYQGELIVIGDPSVKPYDIAYISDVYENMQGGVEVEAVTHILNAQTGFTTSIYVDPLIDIDNMYYQMAHSLSMQSVGKACAMYASLVGISFACTHNLRPLTKIITNGVSKGTISSLNQVSKVLSFFNIDDSADSTGIVSKLRNYATNVNFVGNSDAMAAYQLLAKRINTLFPDDLSRISINNLDDILKRISSINDIDTTRLNDLLNLIKDKKKVSDGKYTKQYNELVESLNSFVVNKNKTITDSINSISKQVAKNVDDYISAGGKLDSVMAGYKTILDTELTDVKYLQKYQNAIEELSKLSYKVDGKDVKIGTQVFANLDDATKLLTKSDDIVKTATKFTIKYGDEVADVLKTATVAAQVSNPILLVVTMVIEFLIECVICGTALNSIKRWMRNLETLRIYPLMKNGKVFTAGLNGSRGIVIGSPTANVQGWLQSAITDFFSGELFPGNNLVLGIANFILGDLRDLETIAEKYRRDNGLVEPDSQMSSQSVLNTVASVYENMYQYNGLMASRLMADRISSLTGEDEDAASVFTGLAIEELSNVEFSPKINGLVYLEDYLVEVDYSKKLDYSKKHNIQQNTVAVQFDKYLRTLIHVLHYDYPQNTINVYWNGKTLNMPYFDNNGYKDVPLVCLEIYNILKDMASMINSGGYDTIDKKAKIVVTNALLPGCLTSWHCTGYACTLYVENLQTDRVREMLQKTQSAYNNIFGFWECKDDNDNNQTIKHSDGTEYQLFEIIVYPQRRLQDNFTVSSSDAKGEN